MLWLGVDLTTVIPSLRISLLLMFVSCNVFKIVFLESLPTPLSTHTSLLLETPFLKHTHSVYNACKSQTDCVFLRVPHFATSVYKSKHFSLSLAYDAPKTWNDLLPLLSTHSESSKPTSLQKHIHTSFCFSCSLSMVMTAAMSHVNDYEFLFFCMECLKSVFTWIL